LLHALIVVFAQVDQLGGLLPYVLDGGTCGVGVESTIVGFEENDVVVYRLGGLSVEDLQLACGAGVTVRVEVVHSSNPAAPGMLKSHYAPSKPLYLLPHGAALPQQSGGKSQRVGLISVLERAAGPWSVQHVLCPSGAHEDGAEAAQHLFAALRAMDRADVDVIYAEECLPVGLGRAVNDRLKRAAHKE
jgi:L-threonylcarbamoyladenylate synthase